MVFLCNLRNYFDDKELNKVQRRNPEEFSISKLKESMVKSSCEIVKSDKFSKHEGCIKVKNFEKAKIESLHDDFISISSETEFKKEVSSNGNSLF